MFTTKVAAYILFPLATWCLVASVIAGSHSSRNGYIAETYFWAFLILANTATLVTSVSVILED